jgi:hypothetical protein
MLWEAGPPDTPFVAIATIGWPHFLSERQPTAPFGHPEYVGRQSIAPHDSATQWDHPLHIGGSPSL